MIADSEIYVIIDEMERLGIEKIYRDGDGSVEYTVTVKI